MKLRLLLTTAAAAFGMQASAQTWVSDSVDMTPTYANDIYYNLKTGGDKSQPGNDWHLAFQMSAFGEPSFNASVRANHIKAKVSVFPLHIVANDANFASTGASDTVGKASINQQSLNYDTSWGEGAFTRNRSLSNPFDFGWGKYDMSTHFVTGDSLYLVTVGTAGYKVWIQKYISLGDTVGYRFRVATLDNSVDNSVFIKRKPDYADRLWAYYDITNNKVIDREPSRGDWDMVFTQYAKVGSNGLPIVGPGALQGYVGALTNLRVQVAKVKTADADNAKHNATTTVYSKSNNTIGDDWKSFNGSAYVLDTVTYFVKSYNSQEYHQIRFTRFDGTGTGKSVFDVRRSLATTTVKEVTNNVSAYALVPNPATNYADMMIDAKENAANSMMIVTDISGKIVQRNAINLEKGMNGFRINTGALVGGTYFVTVTNGSWKISDKLIVQH